MKRLFASLVVALTLVATAPRPARAADESPIQPDVIYGHKDGMALTFDVIKPAKPNGAGILWIQSGGWYSTWVDPKDWPAVNKPFLDKGYTVFIVRHGSAPKYAIPDAVEDVRRSVRFIRLHGKDWGVNPDRLGVLGGSAGGHLTLVLATTADEGDPMAADEVLKQSDRIAAAVALYPPTDISDWVTNPPEAIKKIPALKPPLTFDEKKAPDLSPLLHVTDKTTPLAHDSRRQGRVGADRTQPEDAGGAAKGEGGLRTRDRQGGRPRLQRRAEQGAGRAGDARLVRQAPGGEGR